MKVSLNWIKDYVDLPQDMDLTRLAYDLTMSTVEVEGATDLARQFDHMLVGQIAEVSTLARSTVSHHLKVLREAGVLIAEREGKEIFFHVNKPFLQDAFGKVTDYLHSDL